MITRLVANGCSYMQEYCAGSGHVDLAENCGLESTEHLAIPGSANSRIIRSTLKHSYTTNFSTLYVIGLTFASRWELPINDTDNTFEGRWVNPQSGLLIHQRQWNWSQEDTKSFADLSFKAVAMAQKDQIEDLMYRLLSMLHDLRSRGHQALIFNQVDNQIADTVGDPRFELFHSDTSFIKGLTWLSIPWQQQQGAKVKTYPPGKEPPMEYQHVSQGQHQYLNSYLTNYIQEHKILQ